jgi:class 3 adenylate cyclase/tetratricopeptide (TPR) repeat protein
MNERKQLEEAIHALEAKRAVLGDAVVEASIAALKKQLDELQAAGVPVDQHRKLVTMLFTDIVGSTEIGRQLEPEEIIEIMEAALRRMAVHVEQHGGRVTRFMGDGFKAVFGDPVAREDDAERAVRAGLAMLGEAQAYAAEIEDEWKITGFNVRVGVNTGMVAVGGLTEAEDTVMGLTVNLGARMEKAAPTGGLLISQYTFRHVRGIFEVKPLGQIEAKGFDEPVEVYLVKEAKPRAFRMQTRGVLGLETPMVGREVELKHIREAFYAASEDEECQVVTVTGEAGVGKSRLVYEFQDWLDSNAEEVHLFQGRCQHGASNLPYALLRDVFSLQFQIQDSAPLNVVKERIEGGFGEILGMDEDGQMRAHVIGQLLGFDFGASPYLTGMLEDAQQLRDRALLYLGEYFQGIAEQAPAVIFLDDVHWADDSSLDAVNYISLNKPKQRILFVCLSRPVLLERRPHWGEGQVGHSRLTLQPLSKRESRRLIGEILTKLEEVPLYLREMVVDGAEGNPYYIEELINMLIANGVIIEGDTRWQVDLKKLNDVDVPTTLAGVLQARLDSLPAEERQVLQQAAVVGRVFWDGALQYLQASTPNGEPSKSGPLDQILSSLRQRELIYQREISAFSGTVEYTFKQTILRDVTYQGVLKKVRQAYHGMTAKWLIEQSGERTGEFTGMIAEHLATSGQAEQAATYLLEAGERAARQYANQEALSYLNRALELTPQEKYAERFDILSVRVQVFSLLGERQTQEDDLSTLAQLAEVLEDDHRRGQLALLQAFHARETSNYPVIIGQAQRAIRFGQSSGVVRLEAKGYLLWGRALLSQGNHFEASDKFNAALTLARSDELSQIEADSLRYLGVVKERLGDQGEAVECFEGALEIYRSIGDRRGEGRVLNRLGNILLGSGELSKGREYYDQFLKICQEIGDRWGEGMVVRNIGDAYLSQSDLSEASAYFEQALQITRQIGNLTIESGALVGLGNISLERSEYESAKAHFEQSLRVARGVGNKPSEGKTLLHIGRFFHRQGDYVRARSYYEQALQILQEIGSRSGQGQVEAYLGLLAHHLGDNQTAEEYCQQALEKARALNHHQNQAFALMALGHTCRGLGLTAEAQAAYQESIDLRDESGQTNLAIESRAGLAGAFLDEGQLDLATAQVDEILQHLASNTLEGTEEPSKITLTCYQVLQAKQDSRAQGILGDAYKQLQEQAAKIEDEDLRHSFLQNVSANREIVSEFETASS